MTEKAKKTIKATESMSEEEFRLRQHVMKKMLNNLEYGKLIKYKGAGREYVRAAISEANLIEAYCVAIQYAEYLVEIFLDENGHLEKDKDDACIRNYGPVMEALYAKTMISKSFLSEYKKTCGKRHKIVHSITKREDMIKKINTKETQEMPLNLMNEANKFFIENSLELNIEGKVDIKPRFRKKIVQIAIENLKDKDKNKKIAKGGIHQELARMLLQEHRKINKK